MSYASGRSVAGLPVRAASRVYVQVWLVVVLIAFIGAVYHLADAVNGSRSRSQAAVDAITLLQSQTVTNQLDRCVKARIAPATCFRVVRAENGFDPSTYKP